VKFNFASNDSEDAVLAMQAAEQMAKRFQEPVCILFDYSTVLLRLNDEPALEIVYPEFFKRGKYG
jgi:hypothetical protein